MQKIELKTKMGKMKRAVRPGWKAFARATRGEGMVSYGIVAGLIAVFALSGLSVLGQYLAGEFRDTATRLGSAETVVIATRYPIYASPCGELYAEGERMDGLFVAPASDGSTGLTVACHFETRPGLEGGWTVVASQRETAPASSWDEGIETSRSDPGYFDTSFALSERQLPDHAAFAVGRRLDSGAIEILDGVAARYTAGSLAYVAEGYLESLETAGHFYDIHRHVAENFCGHEPESDHRTNAAGSEWSDTLTFNLRSLVEEDGAGTCGQVEQTFAFSPNAASQDHRGYAYDGYKGATSEPYSWIVLVR